jgi:hypothetical protein
MPSPDVVQLAAVVTLATAAVVALVADRPPRAIARTWRYPATVIALAIANIGLTAVVTVRPAPVTGTILLGTAVLLVYAAHRRARAARPRPPRPRRSSGRQR